jgi:hypothetical protein
MGLNWDAIAAFAEGWRHSLLNTRISIAAGSAQVGLLTPIRHGD